MEGPLFVGRTAGVDGVVRDVDLVAGDEQIEHGLENADVGLDAGDHNLFSWTPLDAKVLVANTRKVSFQVGGSAESGGEGATVEPSPCGYCSLPMTGTLRPCRPRPAPRCAAGGPGRP